MSVFLSRFILPIEIEDRLIRARMEYNGGPLPYIDNVYPCRLFADKELSEISFDRMTVLYGGNGSGKSTLLNLIANKLGLERIAPFNSSEMFDMYTKECQAIFGDDDEGEELSVPAGSRIITSDDVFDYMLAVRSSNDEISENIEIARDEWVKLKCGDTIKFTGMEDYEAHRLQVIARNKNVSRRKFIRQTAGKEVKLNSNGETALEYFNSKLKYDTLYCLDEPENSLSPAMQLKLADILAELTRFGGCQFIISTHSPFLLAAPGARIYDLDSTPVETKSWWELENPKLYYKFFEQHRNLFEE